MGRCKSLGSLKYIYIYIFNVHLDSLNPAAIQETQVRSLGHEDPLEKGMATHSSILARIPWTEEPGYSPWDCNESDTTEQLIHTFNSRGSILLFSIMNPLRMHSWG